MNAIVDQPREIFHCSFSRLFGAIVSWAVPIAVAIIVIEDWKHLNVIRLLGLAFACAGGMLVGAVLSAAAYKYFTLEIHVEGVRGCGCFGFYYDQGWSDIKSVRTLNFGGLKYVRLYSRTSSRVMWIPLFLAEDVRFFGLVDQYTSEDNPFGQFARDRLRGKKGRDSASPVPIRIIHH